jgi:hypothetical protein
VEHGHRLRRVDLDVAIAIAVVRALDFDVLVPAVHARHGVGLHGERQVLVHAAVGPPHAFGVLVARFERTDVLDATEAEASL